MQYKLNNLKRHMSLVQIIELSPKECFRIRDDYDVYVLIDPNGQCKYDKGYQYAINLTTGCLCSFSNNYNNVIKVDTVEIRIEE